MHSIEKRNEVCVFHASATLAMQSRVKIVLKERLPQLKLLGFQFETQDSGRVQSVPIYLAIHLARTNLCHIQCPEWLNQEHLHNVLLEELHSESTFAPGLPVFYYEIFKALDDAHVECVRECRSIVTRICLVRCRKIRSKQIVNFQHVGSAETRINRMTISGSPK